MVRQRWTARAALFLTLGAPALAAAQAAPLVIRGRIISTDSSAIAGAVVEVLSITGAGSVMARSGRDGRFTVYLPQREANYRITARRIGYRPAAALLSPADHDRIVSIDLMLSPSAFELAALLVRASPEPLDQSNNEAPGIGALDADALSRAALASEPGDLTELAALIPGITAGDSGISVLGLPPSSNNTTVNGAHFSGGMLPPDAIATMRVATSTFDPARGEFSGALTTVETRAGSDIWQGGLSGRLSPRALTWSDHTNPAPTEQSGQLSGFMTGPLVEGRLQYFAAGLITRGSAPQVSLTSSPDELRTALGISDDSLAAFTAALRRNGIPVAIPQSHRTRTDAVASLQLNARLSSLTTAQLTGIADLRDQQGLGIGPFTTGTPALTNRDVGRWLGAELQSFGHGIAYRGQLTVDHRRTSNAAAVSLPSGSVTIGTTDAAGNLDGVRSLRFGGSAAGARQQTATTIALRNSATWLPGDGRHAVSVGVEWRHATATIAAVDPPGHYDYHNLSDLADNRPSRFSRTAGAVTASGRANGLAGWIGDNWTVSPHVQIQGGARLDLLRPLSAPPPNPELSHRFGLRVDRLPRQTAFSPRIGFTWQSYTPPPGHPGAAAPASGSTTSGALPVDNLSGILALTELNLRPWITVSGGYGVFRSQLGPQAPAIAALAGRSGGTTDLWELTCVGDNIAPPDWLTPGAPPADCIDPVVSRPLSSIRGYARDYRSPTRTSLNLGVTGINIGGWRVGGTLIQAWYTSDDPVDLNLNRRPLFRLDQEGGRPVFVPSRTIDQRSGVVALGASRRDDSNGRVMQIGTMTGGRTTQIQAQLLPPLRIYQRIGTSLSYIYSSYTEPRRGLDPLADDPLALSSRHHAAHQFVLNATLPLGWFRLTTRFELRSGLPYTPLVWGDVNGDGIGADAAFVPAQDSDLGRDIEAALRGAPAAAARCVNRQAGAMAGIDSCRGPWQTRVNLYLAFTPPRTLGIGRRLSFSLGLVNAAAAAQRLLGISPGALSGDPAPDPRLLLIDGFDPRRNAFSYRVNSGFGRPLNGGGARSYPTFGVQLRATWRFGGPRRDRVVSELELMPPGDTPWTLATALGRLRQLVPDPAGRVLSLADSLALAAAQRDSVATIAAANRRLIDAALTPIARTMVERQHHLTDADLTAALHRVRQMVDQISGQTVARLEAVLSPLQRERLRLLLIKHGDR